MQLHLIHHPVEVRNRENGDGGDFLEALLGVLTNLSKLYIREEIQEQTLDIGVLCSSAITLVQARVHRYTHYALNVKGTLIRQPWFVFCVLCPAAGGWRNRESSTRPDRCTVPETLANVGRSSLWVCDVSLQQ
jgi:hypothetical protein